MKDELDALPPMPSDDYVNVYGMKEMGYYIRAYDALLARNKKLCEALRTLLASNECEDCGYLYLVDVDVDEARAVLAACEVKDND